MPERPLLNTISEGAFATLAGNRFQALIHLFWKKYRSAFKRNEFLYILTPLFLVTPFLMTKKSSTGRSTNSKIILQYIHKSLLNLRCSKDSVSKSLSLSKYYKPAIRLVNLSGYRFN